MARRENTNGYDISPEQRRALAERVLPWWRFARVAVYPLGLLALAIFVWIHRHDIMTVLR